jgi:hypothetical protein
MSDLSPETYVLNPGTSSGITRKPSNHGLLAPEAGVRIISGAGPGAGCLRRNGSGMSGVEAMPEAAVFVIGVLFLGDDVELRCVREPWGWRPDMLVDRRAQTVDSPPTCIQLDDETIRKLDDAWEETRA